MANSNTFFLLVLIAFISTIKSGKYYTEYFKVWLKTLNKQFFIYVVQL